MLSLPDSLTTRLLMRSYVWWICWRIQGPLALHPMGLLCGVYFVNHYLKQQATPLLLTHTPSKWVSLLTHAAFLGMRTRTAILEMFTGVWLPQGWCIFHEEGYCVVNSTHQGFLSSDVQAWVQSSGYISTVYFPILKHLHWSCTLSNLPEAVNVALDNV